MQRTFFANNKVGDHLLSTRLAVMQLSLLGHTVLQVHSRTKDQLPSIEIDRPLEIEGVERKAMMHADKKIGFCEQWGCRIYWREDADGSL